MRREWLSRFRAGANTFVYDLADVRELLVMCDRSPTFEITGDVRSKALTIHTWLPNDLEKYVFTWVDELTFRLESSHFLHDLPYAK